MLQNLGYQSNHELLHYTDFNISYSKYINSLFISPQYYSTTSLRQHGKNSSSEEWICITNNNSLLTGISGKLYSNFQINLEERRNIDPELYNVKEIQELIFTNVLADKTITTIPYLYREYLTIGNNYPSFSFSLKFKVVHFLCSHIYHTSLRFEL